VEAAGFAHQDVEATLDAALTTPAMLLAYRSKSLLEQLGQRGVVRIDDCFRVVQRLTHRLGGLETCRQGGERVLIGPRGLALLPGLLEVLRVLQQRRQVSRLQLQRFLDGIQLLGTPAERLEAAGEVGPERGMTGIGGGGALEQCVRLLGGATGEHAHAELVEDRRMIGGLPREPGEQLIGLGRAPGGRRCLGGLQCADDRCLIELHGSGGIHEVLGSSGLTGAAIVPYSARRPRPLTHPPESA